MNNIQKSFKAKSALRGMADGGTAPREVDPRLLGSGMAARAGQQIQRHNQRTASEIDALFAPQKPAPTPPPRDAQRPRGMADGGPAPRGADPRLLGSGMAARAGQQIQSRNQRTASEIDALFAPPPKPAPRAPARSSLRAPGMADGGEVDRIMNSRDQSIFTPQERKQFAAMGQAAEADAAQMQSFGVEAGMAAQQAARPAELPSFDTDDMAPPELELADGGKVKGKGGPTDDKVGPVALSDGEYVLPADTVKIVGRDNLDALRLATHDFVDEGNKPKVSGLRKMADGGTVFTDRYGNAGRGRLPPGRAMVPYQPPAAAAAAPSTAMVPTAAPSPASSAARAAAAPAAAPAAASGGLRGALGSVGRFTAGPVPILAGAAYAAATDPAGAARGTNETLRGVQPRVNVRFPDGSQEPYKPPTGWTPPAQPAAVAERYADLGRIADGAEARAPALAAAASRQGPALAAAPQRAGTVDDAMRNLRLGSAPGGGFAPSGLPDVYQRDNPRAGEAGQSRREYVGIGRGGQPEGAAAPSNPMMDELRSALRGLGSGGGAQVPRGAGDNAESINKRFDDLSRQLSGMYGRKGQGNLARRLLELEQARSGALDADARNQTSSRGQDINAASAAAATDQQARAQALQTIAGLAGQQATAQSALRAGQGQAAVAAEKRDDERANRASDSLVSYTTRQFGEDSAEGKAFENSFRATNPDFMTMPEGDRESLLAQFRETWEAQRPVRERAAALGRPSPVGEAQIGEAAPVTLGDWWNDRATMGDWWESYNFLSPNDPTARVIPTADGASNFLVSEKDLITRPDGSKRQDVMARISSLRSKEQ